MAFLTPQKVRVEDIGNKKITIKEVIVPDTALASKVCGHIPKGGRMKPCKPLGGSGAPRGVTIHNTEDIKTAAGTHPAEQYCRATWPNCNMSGVIVHFYVWRSEIWQLLDETEQGWHAADGATRRTSNRPGVQIGGNLDTIAIEVIGRDSESEDTAAKLTAYLLRKYGLTSQDVYTHKYFYPRKNCPAYILPHWDQFVAEIERYYGEKKNPEVGGKVDPATPYLVRVTEESVNIRKGPGTNYSASGSITDKGVYTIVEESTGPGARMWGKLKSGAGWISLDSCTKV